MIVLLISYLLFDYRKVVYDKTGSKQYLSVVIFIIELISDSWRGKIFIESGYFF